MRFGPNMKKYLPRRLFARTFLIIVVPLLCAQMMATWIFYDRHHQSVTTRLAQAVAGEMAMIRAELRERPISEADVIFLRAKSALELDISYSSDALPLGVKAGDLLRRTLTRELEARDFRDFVYGPVDENQLVLYLTEGNKTLVTKIPRKRLYTATTGVFIGWMVGSAMLLVTVSLVFMRNQIRPIHRLAEAAEKFGKGLDGEAFKPEGAREVRQAAAAFQVMRNRLRRMIDQRTAMLAAISHDLRTPLTRMRLQLALLPENTDTEALIRDIKDMESMVEAYLAFARGEEAEKSQEFDVVRLVAELAAKPMDKPIFWSGPATDSRDVIAIDGRPQAIRRAVTNLLANAARYGSAVWITVNPGEYTLEIIVEDDGPGIPDADRERVFKPFFQLGADDDGAPKGSAGLGLTITRDIARAHGGDVILDESQHGGLKAILRLPL